MWKHFFFLFPFILSGSPPQVKYLNDKKEIPIFESGRKERYTTKQAVDILFTQASLVDMCSAQPLGVRQTMSFLINISKLSNWNDIKADRNGVYDGVLRCGVWTVSCDASQHDTNLEIIAKKKQNLIDDNQFHLTINSKRNKATPGLVRSIFLLTNRSGKFVNDACLLAAVPYFNRRGHSRGPRETPRKQKRRTISPFSPYSKEHPG